MKKQTVYRVLLFLLILLWVYASLSKLFDYSQSKGQMLNQVFPKPVALILTWLVPTTEFLTGILLILHVTIKYGLWLSLFLLTSFTFYIAGGLLHLYFRVPCTCGGVISHLSWGWHLVFNLSFLVLNLYAIILSTNERGYRQKIT